MNTKDIIQDFVNGEINETTTICRLAYFARLDHNSVVRIMAKAKEIRNLPFMVCAPF